MDIGFTRRRFCQAVAACAAIPGLAAAGTSTVNSMLTRRIPSSGELLPVIGLGTSDVFDVGADEAARAPLAQVLKILLEAGGSLLDTSPMYGRAEGVSGELVEAAGARARMFLATKVWTTGKAEGLRQIEDSMRLLKTGVLDLVQVHNLVDLATQLANVRALKEAGRVRYIGITHYTVAAHAELERVIGREALDFVQFNYSIVTRDAEQRLLPLAAERKVAVLVNRPYEDGALFARVRGKPLPEWAAEFGCTSWGQFFLKFIVSHPAVSCVIPATSNPRHMLDNAAAGHGRLPEQPMREKMAAYFAAL
ncbi:MAG: aldo/keto reductase [Pseudomonadales bacterium]|nr:aldo/keto reductase [Pseudomonadales bacterium]MBP6229609.1 aldo/keto reductase [Pseudomonadales bacterium]